MLNVISGIFSEGAPPVSPTSYESISTVTVGSGGSSTVTFSSIPSTYKHLQIRYIARDTYPATYDYTTVKFNGSTSGYSWHFVQGNGSGVNASAGSSAAFMKAGVVSYANDTANCFAAGVLDVLDYADTNKYKTMRLLNGVDLNGSGAVNLSSGSYQSTSAVTSITFASAGTAYAQNSVFALYGIKG